MTTRISPEITPSPPMPAITGPPGSGPGRILPRRLALGIAVPVVGEPLIITAAIAVSSLRPGSGPQVFLAAQMLGIAGCAAVWQRARARGDRSLTRGLAIGLAIALVAALLCAAFAFVVAAMVMSQPD